MIEVINSIAAFQEIPFSDFLRLDIRVGQIIDVRENEKSRHPAFILTIDFGDLGIKTSSAQITDNYSKDTLIGKQIIAIINFTPKRVAGVKSEVLVLAAVCQTSGTVLIEVNLPVKNGVRIS